MKILQASTKGRPESAAYGRQRDTREAHPTGGKRTKAKQQRGKRRASKQQSQSSAVTVPGRTRRVAAAPMEKKAAASR